MTDKKQSESSIAEFDIKHRVTGAAVLLFVGALLIPWLLGPPSEASKRLEVIVEDNLGNATPASEIEQELLAETSPVPVDIEETVYISKITPLDSGGVRQSDNVGGDEAESATKKSDDAATPAPATQSDETSKAESKKTAVVDNSADEKKAAEQEQRRAAAAAKKRTEEAAQQAEQKKREQALQTALAAESQTAKQTAKIDVGWVVQVGLYLEEKGAESKMKELRQKGFRPGSTIVDTNRGPRTGTRVWLGPFEKRTAAEQQNKLLREQTGKDGFIRVYP